MIGRAIDPYFSNTLSLEWKKCKVGRRVICFGFGGLKMSNMSILLAWHGGIKVQCNIIICRRTGGDRWRIIVGEI